MEENPVLVSKLGRRQLRLVSSDCPYNGSLFFFEQLPTKSVVLLRNIVCRFGINLHVPGIACPGITCCPYCYAIVRRLAWHILFERTVFPKRRSIHCDVWTWVIDEWKAHHWDLIWDTAYFVSPEIVLMAFSAEAYSDSQVGMRTRISSHSLI